MKLLIAGAVGLGTDYGHSIRPNLPPGTDYVAWRHRRSATYIVAVPDDSPLEASSPESVAFWADHYGVNPSAWRVG